MKILTGIEPLAAGESQNHHSDILKNMRTTNLDVWRPDHEQKQATQ